MAIVNFSVPDEIKKAFNKAFAKENKSAILAQLMRRAVEERVRQKRRVAAIEELLKLRAKAVPAGDAAIRSARRKGRP